LIRVIDVGSLSSAYPVCADGGHELNFSADAIRGGRLRAVIAETLVQVYRYATPEHWCLVDEMIEAPLARWEQRRGPKASDAEHAKKVDALERRFLRVHDREVARIMRRWGHADAPRTTRRDIMGRGKSEV